MSAIGRTFWIALVIGVVGSIGLLWLPCGEPPQSDCIPLGIPGEWTWGRITLEQGEFVEFLLGWLTAGIALVAYTTVAWLGVLRLKRCSRIETVLWLTGLVVVAFFWLTLLQESPKEGYRSSKTAQVLYYPGSSGYFFEARYQMSDLDSFLAGYEDRMAEGDVLHVGTHPPGLFVFHRGLIKLCQQSPQLVQQLLEVQPQSVETAFSLIAERTHQTPSPLLPPDRAAIWLAALITQLVGAVALVPLYALLRRTLSRQISWMACSFWPLVPALAVFLPKSDVIFPFIGLSFLYCWLDGLRRNSPMLCVLAGLLFWLGMFFSLAHLPFALLAALLTAWEIKFSENWWSIEDRWKKLLAAIGWATATFLIAVVILRLAFGVNLFSVWWWNYHNHAAFYDHYSRTWWKWLLVNPVELSLAAGLPIFVLALTALLAASRSMRETLHEGWRRSVGPCFCCAVVWGALWLSGKNLGEAARLWLPLIPWLIWSAAVVLETGSSTGDSSTDAPPLKRWLVILVLQGLVCIATVTRVAGFQT